jgi:hypothetical protein
MLAGKTGLWGVAWLLTLCAASSAVFFGSEDESGAGFKLTDPLWLGLVFVGGVSVVWAAILVLDHAALWVLGSDVIGACLVTVVAWVQWVRSPLNGMTDGPYWGMTIVAYAVLLAFPLGVGAALGAGLRVRRTRRTRIADQRPLS